MGLASAASWFHFTADTQQQRQASSTKAELPVHESQFGQTLELSDHEYYQNIIKARDAQIANLNSQLASFSDRQNQLPNQLSKKKQSPATIGDDVNNDPQLKKMSMQDFEKSLKDSFADRFKGVVLELSGNELKALQDSYSNSSDKNDWSYQYENSIARFLTENDQNGDHFIQTIGCNTKICRLEINTNNDETWNTLYASMTLQPWYKTITVEENSDYPGNHIYYLPSIEN